MQHILQKERSLHVSGEKIFICFTFCVSEGASFGLLQKYLWKICVAQMKTTIRLELAALTKLWMKEVDWR